MGKVKEQMMEEQEKERNFKMEEAEHEQEEKEKNYVTCMRCGIEEEGEERLAGDETYYLCDICYDDMNG